MPGKPLQPKLTFVDKALALSIFHVPRLDKTLAQIENVTLGWKGLRGTNTLDYEDSLMTDVKSCATLDPGLI